MKTLSPQDLELFRSIRHGDRIAIRAAIGDNTPSGRPVGLSTIRQVLAGETSAATPLAQVVIAAARAHLAQKHGNDI